MKEAAWTRSSGSWEICATPAEKKEGVVEETETIDGV